MYERLTGKPFKKHIGHCLFQSFLAALFMVAIMFFIKLVSHLAIVAALGGTTFLVFARPHAISAQPRRIIGGHVVGLLCGTLVYFVSTIGPLMELDAQYEILPVIGAAIAVGLSIFVMAITNTEHPPAAGTALGFFTREWSQSVVIFVIVVAVSLAIIQILFRDRFEDLF